MELAKFARQGNLLPHFNYFSDLAEAHKHYANVARGIADIAGLISPEQLTLILAAAVLPTLQLVLPPEQILPLSTPPPPPKTATTVASRQEMIKYCRNMILPDPSADVFKKCEERTPTQVLAAAVFCTLENIYSMKQHPEQRLLPVFALQLPSSTSLSLVLITRAAHTHTKGNERQQTQPALAQKFKTQTLVHLQHPLHRARHHTKCHQHRKHPANLTQITLKQGRYHRKTPCLQPVRIPFPTSHLNNLCTVSQ